MLIKATVETYLKKAAVQCSNLTDDQKVKVLVGKEYTILKHTEALDGHYQVDLGYGAGTWYVWSGHWHLPWEDHQEEVDNHAYAQSLVGANLSQIVSHPPKSWRDVNWSDFNSQVSKYFTLREVTNGDRRRLPPCDEVKNNIFTLAQELDKVRSAWGSPIIVTSWYRPPAINKDVGGSDKSQHLYGKAVDIKPAQGDIKKFQKWLDCEAWKDKALGYGAKKGFVHCDLRPGNYRWNY